MSDVTLSCLLKVIKHDIKTVGSIFKSILSNLILFILMSIPAVLHLIIIIVLYWNTVVDWKVLCGVPILLSGVIILICVIFNMIFWNWSLAYVDDFVKLFFIGEVMANVVGISFLLTNSVAILFIMASVMIISACACIYWGHVCDVCENK